MQITTTYRKPGVAAEDVARMIITGIRLLLAGDRD